MESKTVNRGQVIYFSHGGGPMPILGDPSHDKMVEFMEQLSSSLRRPEVIVVFSAHWEENRITIQSGENPGILYDYYGFPESAYSITYPSAGNPELAERISELLSKAGIDSALDGDRPYDHGSYIPLKMIYPEADIPVIQVSLLHNLSPAQHIEMGKALAPLMKEPILFIGSGFSFHNMMHFDLSGRNREDEKNNAFQDALIHICCEESDDERTEALINWTDLPGARYCHPREEHLLPIHVCAGLGSGKAVKAFDDYIAGKRGIAVMWG